MKHKNSSGKGKNAYHRPGGPGARRFPGNSRGRFDSSPVLSVLPPHVVRVGRDIATENLLPGQTVYGERLGKVGGVEVRLWDPRRSKLASTLLKGMNIYLSEEMIVLYLGVSSGTTASHISDICRNGMIFGVDPAPRVLREFFLLSRKRENLAPLFEDAAMPERYAFLVPKVDLVYQDVAQRSQAEIFLKNCKLFLKKGGRGLLMVKARSVDVRKDPEVVFEETKRKLEQGGLRIISTTRLEPFERDHLAIYCSWDRKP
jgi:fibrillarin-like pre-rRNA processing protein